MVNEFLRRRHSRYIEVKSGHTVNKFWDIESEVSRIINDCGLGDLLSKAFQYAGSRDCLQDTPYRTRYCVRVNSGLMLASSLLHNQQKTHAHIKGSIAAACPSSLIPASANVKA
jgi:hypothetical protein